jgi:hypothetical protein
MTQDAFEPGPDSTYAAFPRRLDGTPAWSDTPETDGIPVAGRGPNGLVTPMPRGIRYQLMHRTGERITIDLTPRGPGGEPINPPVLP